MSKFVNKVDQFMIFLAGVGLISLMLLISVGVVTRYIFGYSIPAAYAITENYLMPLAVLGALGFAYRSGIFPRVDTFVKKIGNESIRNIINSITILVELLLFVFITYYLFKYSFYTIANGNGFNANGLDFPLYPVYILMSFSFLWLSFAMFLKFMKMN